MPAYSCGAPRGLRQSGGYGYPIRMEEDIMKCDIVLRKILSSILCLGMAAGLAACGNPFAKQEDPKATANPYAITVLGLDELEEDTYYIRHGDEFYEIPEIECSFNDDGHNDQNYILTDMDSPAGIPERTIFYSKDKTELLIPTLYQDDQLVYKSSREVTDNFAWERYMDGGYTIGVCGIGMNNLNKPSFTNWYTNILDGSEVEKELGRVEDEDDEIYASYNINSIDGVEVTKENVSEAGYITGLPAGRDMQVDFYLGTQLRRMALQADARIFYDFENYWTKGMSYSEDGYIVIRMPEIFKTGYYKVNTSGMFRYVDEPYSENTNLSELKYNQAYFIKDKDGRLAYKQDEEGNYIYE